MGVNLTSNDSKWDWILLHSQLAMIESWRCAKRPEVIGAQFDGPTWQTIRSRRTVSDPATQFQILLPHLIEFSIPTFVGKFLRQGDIADVKRTVPISINTLVKTLDCPGSALKLAFTHGLDPAGNRGKITFWVLVWKLDLNQVERIHYESQNEWDVWLSSILWKLR
jgi:hypothetical protein